MLTKEEESRLEAAIRVIENANKWSDGGYIFVPLSLDAQMWLAEKLKETNDELSRVTEELHFQNQEFANYVEAHE
jgi:hypothetical protein